TPSGGAGGSQAQITQQGEAVEPVEPDAAPGSPESIAITRQGAAPARRDNSQPEPAPPRRPAQPQAPTPAPAAGDRSARVPVPRAAAQPPGAAAPTATPPAPGGVAPGAEVAKGRVILAVPAVISIDGMAQPPPRETEVQGTAHVQHDLRVKVDGKPDRPP